MAGVKSDVNNNLHFIGETGEFVCYPVGHNIAIYESETKSQKYISGIEGSLAITAMAVTKSKKFLAVAERTDRTPVVSIYDLKHPQFKRKKFISSNELKKENKEFISIAFCPKNEKLLVTLTNIPQQNVYIW
jgi:hypothetical protein